MTRDARRAPRAAGTRGFREFWDVLRTGFRPPSKARAAEDVRAVEAGQSRAVSCSLKADFGPYPRRLRQGLLELNSTSPATWHPFWSFRRRSLEIALIVTSLTVRDAAKGEHVKKGGTFLGVIPVPRFQVVVCATPQGTIEFAVPDTDIALVASVFRPGPSL